MSMKEEINSLKKERVIWMGMAITFLFILVMVLIFSSNVAKNKNICYDFKSINETLNDIEKNCGSTQITHKWDDNTGWYVFKTIYEGNKPNYNYYELGECLFVIYGESEQ